jgi:NAD(P)-dependent dehydrogenase (short-subunit alcohol dehydrogenase family)
MSELQRLFGLDGKVALVTGGGRGLGRMIAEGFIAAGIGRVYIASRDGDALARAADEIAPDGRCIAIAADLSAEKGCTALADAVGARESKLHVLVNNSGASWISPLRDFPEAAWDKVFDLNLKGPFFLTRAIAPLLEGGASEGNPARIINIGSIAGEIANSMSTYPYGLSKGALHQLTRMLAKELAPRITVNAIAPGRFPTKMTKAISDDPARLRAERDMIPLGRWGEAEDVAGAAVFLASRAGAYLSGAIVPVDGGAMLAVG